MNPKEAIQLRCNDCKETSRLCEREDCILYRLHLPAKGSRRTKAIFAYCSWCLNGYPFSVCSSPDCSLHIYRLGLKRRTRNPRRSGFSESSEITPTNSTTNDSESVKDEI